MTQREHQELEHINTSRTSVWLELYRNSKHLHLSPLPAPTGGVVDVRGRSDFSRFDPRPPLATLVRPRSEDLFLWSEDLFVRRRLRSDFSRFDPASPGDGPTLATLVRPRRADFIATLLAAWIELGPFCGGARRCGGGGRAALS